MIEEKNKKLVINSLKSLSRAVGFITEGFKARKHLVVSVRFGKDRTLSQNALWFAMYQRIAQMTEMGDVTEVRRYCKLHHGVSILLNESETFREAWDYAIKPLPYEYKLAIMAEHELYGPDGFPVTSLFDRGQGIRYTERIVRDFTQKGVIFDDLLSQED